MVLGIGLLAHAALWSLDTVALMKSAADKRAVVATLVTAAGGSSGGDLAATAEAMLPSTGGAPSGLLPLLGRAARALQPLGTSVSLLSVDYGADAGLTMALEAADLTGLQTAEAALSGAGLAFVNAGAAVEGGRAHEKVTITHGGSA